MNAFGPKYSNFVGWNLYITKLYFPHFLLPIGYIFNLLIFINKNYFCLGWYGYCFYFRIKTDNLIKL